MGLVIGIVVALSFLAIGGRERSVYGQEPAMLDAKRVRPSLSVVDDYAQSIKNDDQQAVRNLTDIIAAVSLFGNSSRSLKDRVFAAEMSWRRGHQSTITEAKVADAINRFGIAVSMPKYYEVTPDQVAFVRFKLLPHFPHILGVMGGTGQPGDKGLTPIGAFFVADVLLRQKLFNADFQKNPDEWYRDSVQSNVMPRQGRPVLVVRPPDQPEAAKFLERLRQDLARGDSASTEALSEFLDRAGF